MTEAVGEIEVGPCSPFFIVEDVDRSLDFYSDKLGFDCRYKNAEADPFFAICGRGSAQIMLKAVGEVAPLPNCRRHEDARWDAFVYTANPLAQELLGREVALHRALEIASDGLIGFEVADPDGYICYFGCPA